jgi:hypothetical protein
MFLWMGQRDAEAPAVCVKLTRSYEEALAIAHATPTTISGLGQWGWLTVPLGAVDLGLVCDWVEESYRNVAPTRFLAELDQRPELVKPDSDAPPAGFADRRQPDP